MRDDQKRELVLIYGHMSDEWLALHYNCIVEHVQRTAFQLNLHKREGLKAGRLWTTEQDEFLVQAWENIPMWQLVHALGRTKGAIKYRAESMGLKRGKVIDCPPRPRFTFE